MHCLRRQLLPPRVRIDFVFCISKALETIFNLFIGTKREAELDDISPSKLKALKATNGTKNGDAPTVVDDDSSNHKNGEYHDDEDEDDDVVC
jgi:hypothetical protein